MSLAQAYRQCRAAINTLFDRRNLLAWGVLLGSLGIVLLTWNSLSQNQQTAATAQFELLAAELSKTLEDRMTDHERILLAGAGLFDASHNVSREDWQAFIQRLNLSNRYPGIQGVGFSQIVPAGTRMLALMEN